MKSDQVFIGNIRRCTKYEENIALSCKTYIDGQLVGCERFGSIEEDNELYKENAILIRVKNGGYVDLERFDSILDYIRLHRLYTKNGFRLGGLIMSTSAYRLDDLFVDEKTLKPYYQTNEEVKDTSILKLKKQINYNK